MSALYTSICDNLTPSSSTISSTHSRIRRRHLLQRQSKPAWVLGSQVEVSPPRCSLTGQVDSSGWRLGTQQRPNPTIKAHQTTEQKNTKIGTIGWRDFLSPRRKKVYYGTSKKVLLLDLFWVYRYKRFFLVVGCFSTLFNCLCRLVPYLSRVCLCAVCARTHQIL